jgi:lipopolysaccharide biosynthesis glycosyltransferase
MLTYPTHDPGKDDPSPVARVDHHLHEKSEAAAANRVATLMCIDAVYLQHAAVCLVSLLANNPDLFFDIVVVRRPNEGFDDDKLRRSLQRFANHSLSFRVFTPPTEAALTLNPRAHYTLDIWNRLWVEEFFAENVDRVLYLDADIVVTGSIAGLWRTDLEGNLVGAVDIPGAQAGVVRLGLAENGYFNSGVLLIDLKEWRRARVLDALISYISAHPEQMVYTPDQDALNACLYDRKKRLDPKWNAVWTFFQETDPVPLPRAELETVRRQACIIHFNNSPKPWSYFCAHPRKAEYKKYLRMTEWRDFVPPDRTAMNRLRKLTAAVLPGNLKAFLRSVQHRIRA